MAGYLWRVLARYTPDNGVASTVNLSTGFLDGGQSRSILTKAEPTYESVIEGRQDVDLNLRPLRRGFRCEVMLRFDMVNPTAHHPTIATLVSRAMDPEWAVELSLDNGAVYREVVLKKSGSPKPIGGKTAAGFLIEHQFACVALLDSYPAIGAGTSW